MAIRQLAATEKSEMEINIPAFTTAVITGNFNEGGVFIIRDETHHPTEPKAGIVIREAITKHADYTWEVTNNYSYTVTYTYGALSADEAVTINDLSWYEKIKEIKSVTYIYVDTSGLMFAIEGDDGYTLYDAEEEFGVRMGDDFVAKLDTPAPMKEFITSSSRRIAGEKILPASVRIDKRDVTLPFYVHGNSPEELYMRKESFLNMLQAGVVNVFCPLIPADKEYGVPIFKLWYTGKSTSYSLSLNRCNVKLSCKFEEPDPTDRTLSA